ncbi:hypothetical protein C2E25_09980 [Geothermobacter hydrogeniphilus]|uniref:Uncharacterized protein n=1 Tax=Geothermobacter hydrogeniphilus TaxID=1969733 RepID=A0A2K2H9G4_9BACT|nr:hypothetical protein [Geothermobacter hydrogeniphilus]PNU19870.1 hypothetical protein C2E25_09980 [Geothermobacter hydrogeniphilus]
MTTSPIIESGMTFGPYPEGHCFYIEKSATYKNVQQGVRMAEFLLFRLDNGKPPVILVIEAKSSTPRPETQPNFDAFIEEIREKLVNAFSLGVASCLKRHLQAEEELPEPFKTLDLSAAEFRFVLVVNGHQEAWLPPIQEALKKSLHPAVKTWALPPTSVAVINDELARQHGLILPDNEEAA